MESLFEAVQSNDITKVKDLVLTNRKGSNNEYLDELVRSVNDAQILWKLFNSCGKEINDYFKMCQYYIFTLAIRIDKDIEILEVILNLNKDCISCCDESSPTPLIEAVSFNCELNTIKFLLENNADVNFSDDDKNVPLHFARNSKVVKLLIENGADINFSNYEEWTPIMTAIQNERDNETILEFIKNGANLEMCNFEGQTSLHLALLFRYGEEIINEICSKNLDYNEEDRMALTPLCYAIDDYRYAGSRKYHTKFIHELINKGFVVSAKVFIHAIRYCKNHDLVVSLRKYVNLKNIDYSFFDDNDYDLLVLYGISVSLKTESVKASLSCMLYSVALSGIHRLGSRGLLGHIFLSNKNITIPKTFTGNKNVKEVFEMYTSELNKMKHENFTENLSYYDFCMKQFRSIMSPFLEKEFTKADSENLKKLFPFLYKEVIVKIKINIRISKRRASIRKLMNVCISKQKERENIQDPICEYVTVDNDAMHIAASYLSDRDINCLLTAAIID